MTMLHLDYQNSHKPVPWLGVILLLLAMATLVLIASYYRGMNERIGYWEAKAGQVLHASERQNSGSQRELKEAAQEIKHANEVLGQITLPWDKLFQAVEWSSGKDVALLTIEPDAEKHLVKISGEAKRISAVLTYIRHLSAQDIFTSVYLQSHQVQQQSPDRPVRFALIANWKEAP